MNKIISKILLLEKKRQSENIELIASENYVNENILKLAGSLFTNKYAEGYPNFRYYDGCEYVDQIENLAIDKLKELFNAEAANVQPHSGSQANAAAYLALLNPGDKVLAMSLTSGGHLTHGFHLNFSGKIYNFHHYNVNQKTSLINYDEIEKLAQKIKPKLIVAGASAYPRKINFKKFAQIAKKINAYLMVDMAHIAGLVAAKLHQNPVKYADVVTSTTHKTLRGPRGGIILCKKELLKKINSAVFPGTQGGPLMHIIAAKAQCFIDALNPNFNQYQKQIILNCQALVNFFKKHNIKMITNGSDNHLLLVDVKTSYNLTGKQAADILTKINITCNKNTIPFDSEKPFITSGIRIGTPAMTSRGFREQEFLKIA